MALAMAAVAAGTVGATLGAVVHLAVVAAGAPDIIVLDFGGGGGGCGIRRNGGFGGDGFGRHGYVRGGCRVVGFGGCGFGGDWF